MLINDKAVEAVEMAGGRPAIGLPAHGQRVGRLFPPAELRKKKLSVEGASKMPVAFRANSS